jgi:hypothetical protein
LECEPCANHDLDCLPTDAPVVSHAGHQH